MMLLFHVPVADGNRASALRFLHHVSLVSAADVDQGWLKSARFSVHLHGDGFVRDEFHTAALT